MEIGVFIPIGSNGWLISTTSPQYKPSFELNKQVTLNAERYGFDFALSMIKLRGFGGKSEFWDHNLESFTLMAGLAAVTSRIKLYATVPTLAVPPAIAARMALDHQFDLQRAVWAERHHRLAAAGIFARWACGRATSTSPTATTTPRNTSQIMRDLWETGVSRLQGRVLHDERLPPAAPARRRRSS